MTDPLLVDIPMAVDTARLHLRPPRAGDGPALHEALAESIAELRRWLGFLPWVAEEQTPASAEIRCRRCEANFISRADLPYLAFARSSGRLVGSVGLHRTDWTVPKTEVGYWVRTSAAGQGYIGEAVAAMARVAFDALRAERIELVTDEENVASRKVAERCGFELEGVLRNATRSPRGELRTTCLYARLAQGAR